MMGLDDRVGYLILGILIGSLLGYGTRVLQTIEKKVDHVEEIVIKRDEKGFMKQRPGASGVALFVVLVLTLFAAISSQKNSNDLADNQKDIDRVTFCTQSYLTQTLVAVNERTTYSRDQAGANIELQKAQKEFISAALQPPALETQRVAVALTKYLEKLNIFVSLATKTTVKQDLNPYPTAEELESCLKGKKESK